MRSRCSCSALLLVLLAAGCGGGAHRGAHRPFAYDHARPFAVRGFRVAATAAWGTMYRFSFAGVDGTRVPALVVVPKAAGRHPAVLWLHGSGGDRTDLIVPAALLARRGAVAMTISEPNDAQTYRPLVVDARRALDLLAGRRDVDPARLGVVGFSLGAQTAAILAGVDPRLKAVGVIAGRGNAVTRYWVHRAHAHLFFQAGTHDEVVPRAQLLALIHAAPGHPKVSWYDAGHEVPPVLAADQIAWQARELG